ncbi:hypothetical protein SLE2022_398510 [Rubroshorea leprosula]
MQFRRDLNLFFKGLICTALVLPLLITVFQGGELSLSESASFLKFIKSVDPQNVLGNHLDEFPGNPCLHEGEGVKCNLQDTSIEKNKA